MHLRGARRPIVAAVAMATTIGAVGSAGAASLGGARSATLLATRDASAAAPPTVLSCDDFARAASTGANLDGRPVQTPAACGSARWTVISGNWTISGGQLRGSSGGATSVLDAGQTDVSVQSTLLNLNGGGRVAGVAIDHTGATRTFLAAVASGGNQVLLQLSHNGSLTTLASASVTFAGTDVLRLTRSAASVTVTLDGVLRISHTLTPAQVATLAAGVRTGLYWSGGNTVRFLDFLVTAAAAP